MVCCNEPLLMLVTTSPQSELIRGFARVEQSFVPGVRVIRYPSSHHLSTVTAVTIYTSNISLGALFRTLLHYGGWTWNESKMTAVISTRCSSICLPSAKQVSPMHFCPKTEARSLCNYYLQRNCIFVRTILQ